ncbi:MAG TPA: 50S ribosomal protein L25/general stress protein Ctc [Aquella sp.]|nr:50S ribosomal protein L25/general stress protein Ctc [Aquella sp.]
MKYANLTATERSEHGRGASRRLRHTGMVPAIIYGSNADAKPVSLDHNTLFYALKSESFHTSILNLDVNGKTEKVLLRDYQMHAFRPQVMHIDFQRVNEKEEISIRIPLHFINEETCYAVKNQNAHVTTILTDAEIRALAKDIPHFIEVDLQNIKIGESIHLSSLVLPPGVKLVNLLRGDDAVVATAAGIVEEVIEEVVAVSAADIPTVADEKKEETQEEEAKKE